MIADRIQKSLADHEFVLDENKSVFVTVSIGICTLSQLPCLDRGKLYHYADQALYNSKNTGRDSISVYDPNTGSMDKITFGSRASLASYITPLNPIAHS